TIALGILASDGLVIAADSQETYGNLQTDQGKILATHLGHEGPAAAVLALSGSGWSSYIDALNQELCASFQKKKPKNLEDVETDLKERLRDFNREHVLPYLRLPEVERPSVSLIVGAQVGGKRCLWMTDHAVVHQVYPYAAVGSGAVHASVVLERLWQLGL